MLRQTFGCASAMRSTLTSAEQAGCTERAADRAATLPTRSPVPLYKEDFFKESQAALARGVHGPGIGCVLTTGRIKRPRNTIKLGPLPCILFLPGPDIMNVDLPGAGPKAPEPSLKDLGLGQ